MKEKARNGAELAELMDGIRKRWPDVRTALTGGGRAEWMTGANFYGATLLIMFYVAVAIFALGWLIRGLIYFVGQLPTWGASSWQWFTSWELTRTITGPLTAYVTSHSAGLPASADLLLTAWAIGAGVLLLCSILGHRGARLGWCLYGALTIAGVWAGAPAGSRWLAGGVALSAWAVLSVLAFAGMMRQRPPSLVTFRMTSDRTQANAEPAVDQLI